MPTLTYEIPRYAWVQLEKIAHEEGVSLRALVLWQLKAAYPFIDRRPQPEAEPQAAA